MLAKFIATRYKMPKPGLNRAGFTMTEMMVIIIVVGILATVSAPPILRSVQINRLQTNTDRMAADLQYARTMSISTNQMLQFRSTTAGYQLIEPISGTVVRETDFSHGMKLAIVQTANFFPWGMADATVFDISNSCGARQVTLLPTGIVEVD